MPRARHLVAAFAVAAIAGAAAPAAAAERLPYENPRLSTTQRVADLLSRMTLEEKVGQMTQTERYQVYDDETPITTYGLGSILSGGGSTPTPNEPEAWADMVDRFQRAALDTRLGIPLLYGIDAVHGNGNALGATVFPHNIGLGATRDPGLVKEVAHVTAIETRATGPQWTFAPCVCAPRDDRWGRTYEGFSEDAGHVIKMETAIDGFQGRRGQLADRDRVLATAKHYAGDGDTEYGTGDGDYTIDQGVAITSRGDFWRKSLRQYAPAVRKHDVGSVMPSFSSVDWTEDGVGNPLKMHAHQELISGTLKGKLGLRRLRHLRLGGDPPDPRRLADPGPHRRQRRHRHDDGAEHVPELHHDAARRGARRARAGGSDRRRRAPDPDQEVRARPVRAPVHRPPQHRQDRLTGAPQGRARGSGEVAGAAQERPPDAAAAAAGATSTSPARTPTTSATRPAAGRSPGRVTRPSRASRSSRARRSSTASASTRAAT